VFIYMKKPAAAAAIRGLCKPLRAGGGILTEEEEELKRLYWEGKVIRDLHKRHGEAPRNRMRGGSYNLFCWSSTMTTALL
jgi:hypothetical protein